jgi:glycosyltransferase involved in cell wall biosynthesis
MIINALKDRSGLKRMGEAGRAKTRELYRWENIARRKAELYSRAVSRRRNTHE